jgi:hypothetical protein
MKSKKEHYFRCRDKRGRRIVRKGGCGSCGGLVCR